MPGTPRHRGRLLVGVLAAAAAVLAMTGCSAGSPQADEPASADVDRTLSLAIVSAPNSFDPAQLVEGQQAFVWTSIFDTLLSRENNTGELQPNAAESWEQSEDGLTLTLTLRDDLTFSSGDPVTAEAVVETMERTRATPGLVQGKFVNVTSISAPDDATVVIEFSEFDPAFLPQLALSAGAIGDPATLADERTATDPVGSGPYTLNVAETVPGTSYVLDRRDDHWNAEAYPYSTVKVTVLQDPTASFNALQAGEVNVASVRPQQLGAISGDAAYTLTEIPAVAVAQLNILDRAGEDFPELGDARVRQAISHAIDREGILTSLLAGAGQVTEQSLSPFSAAYDEDLNGTYDYDPEKAKKLLAEAGYESGFTLRIPSTFTTTAFEATLTQQLAEVGITLEWVPVPPQQAQSVVTSGEYGLVFQIIGLGSVQFEAVNYFGEGGVNNPRNYTDETLDEIFENIDSTVDFEDATKYYQELNAYAVEQSLTVPIVFIGATTVTRDGVTYLDNGANGFSTVRLFGVAE